MNTSPLLRFRRACDVEATMIALVAGALVVAPACGQSNAVPVDMTGDAGVVEDASVASDAASGPVEIRLLAVNDFHGALDPTPATATTPDLGGAAWLAAHVAKQRTASTAFLSAGDLIGGSPLLSGLFHDEPTIEVMNAMRLDFNGVGNHEFDEGTAELLRMQNGGCHPQDGCKSAATYPGAKFRFLAANVVERASGKTVLPQYEIADFGGAKVAFVGLTLKDTPETTVASKITELEFKDEADTVTALVPELRSRGAENIVVLLHQAGSHQGSFDACDQFQGPLVDIAPRMPPQVKYIFAGHSHAAFNCKLGNIIVTSAGSAGRFLTVANFTIDPRTQTASNLSAQNMPVTHDIAPDPTVAAIVARASSSVAPLRDAQVGTLSSTISSSRSPAGEVPLGLVIADAMLWATATDAQLSLMNPGGIRAPLFFGKSGVETADGQVTYGEAFAVQPFSNELATITATGAEIVQALDEAAGTSKHLQPAGITYKWRVGNPGGRVLASDVLVAGNPIVPSTNYRVTVNSIVRAFFPAPKSIAGAGVDLDALVGYLKARSPISVPPSRIEIAN